MEIKLKNWCGHESIYSPSGVKITASKLERGKKYLQTNKIFIREILNIVNKEVEYIQHPIKIIGVCSTQHFATTCPNEATQDEINFILNKV